MNIARARRRWCQDGDTTMGLQIMLTESRAWERISLAILVFGPIVLAANWQQLPAQVPLHYGLLGNPDSWGPKETLLILPLVSLFSYAMFSYGQRHPERSNVPWKINDLNRAQIYSMVKQLLTWEKLAMVSLFSYLQVAGVMIAKKEMDGLGAWFGPITLLAVFGPIVLFIVSGKKFKDVKN
jgi:hypothetical protein